MRHIEDKGIRQLCVRGGLDNIKQRILIDYNKKKLMYRGKMENGKLRVNDGIVRMDGEK